jgi:hypothetical protein
MPHSKDVRPTADDEVLRAAIDCVSGSQKISFCSYNERVLRAIKSSKHFRGDKFLCFPKKTWFRGDFWELLEML